mmetsp:Transcript_93106/g.299659  ORF Transcript_93106/g.299659 Transcript_93106/m.299659 type:complete len:258 (+) Transcript_93106:2200-2973(+)
MRRSPCCLVSPELQCTRLRRAAKRAHLSSLHLRLGRHLPSQKLSAIADVAKHRQSGRPQPAGVQLRRPSSLQSHLHAEPAAVESSVRPRRTSIHLRPQLHAEPAAVESSDRPRRTRIHLRPQPRAGRAAVGSSVRLRRTSSLQRQQHAWPAAVESSVRPRRISSLRPHRREEQAVEGFSVQSRRLRRPPSRRPQPRQSQSNVPGQQVRTSSLRSVLPRQKPQSVGVARVLARRRPRPRRRRPSAVVPERRALASSPL